MKKSSWTLALVACGALATPARAASFDLLTFTVPEGYKLVQKGTQVELTKANATSYCMVIAYTSTPASADLDASFAAEWEAVALKTIARVDAPEPATRKVGNTRAAVGSASSTAGDQPIWAMLVVLDAGASVLSVLVLSPSEEAFEAYEAEIEKLLRGMAVKKVAAAERPSPASPAPQLVDGRLVVPPPARALTVADLAGDWGHNDGITTTYVDRHTGAYAGFASLHFTNPNQGANLDQHWVR